MSGKPPGGRCVGWIVGSRWVRPEASRALHMLRSLRCWLALAAWICVQAAVPAHAQSGAAVPAVVQMAAEALGGADKVRATRNITLIGYGIYAYQMGGGNLTSDPNAPQKWNHATDLRRFYDLEHGRWGALERRNYLFPFAASNGHDFVLVDQKLDGDIGFDTDARGTRRIARYFGGAQHEDGVHMRRMYMLNNPVALVRAMMDPANRLSAPRREGAETVVTLTTREGDILAAGFDPRTHLPSFVRWSTPRDNLGEVTYTTRFTGYEPFGGLNMPVGYRTKLDWRGIDYFQIYVDNYLVDRADMPDLAAPANVRATPEPKVVGVLPVAFPIAKGLWRLNTAGTNVIEFADHLAIFELATNVKQAKANIDFANTLVPGKRVTQVIVTHNHADHVAGLRAAMAEGLTIISRRDNERIFREMYDHPAPDFPDALASKSPKPPFKFMPVDEKLTLSDSFRTVELYWARNNIHMADAIFAYVPSEKLMIEGDIATAAFDFQWWPDNFQDLVDYYHLDVQRLSPVHTVSPTNPNVLSYAEVIDLIKGGVQRARERCAKEQASNHHFAGCPVQSKRY